MYQTKPMELKMIKCPKCGGPMPLKRRQLGYHVCINCSTESAKRGIPVMRGTGDHTWVDLEVLTQEQFERFEEMENKTKSEITPKRDENSNLQGPFNIIETDK
jgi:ssDNA-binding Zn-finger/Zn-ribbon topoisomerase 1